MHGAYRLLLWLPGRQRTRIAASLLGPQWAGGCDAARGKLPPSFPPALLIRHDRLLRTDQATEERSMLKTLIQNVRLCAAHGSGGGARAAMVMRTAVIQAALGLAMGI